MSDVPFLFPISVGSDFGVRRRTENTHTEHEPMTKIYVLSTRTIHNKYLLGFCDRRGRNHNTFSRSPGFRFFLQLKHRENKKKTTNNHFFPHRRRSSVALNHTKIALFSFCRCFFHLETEEQRDQQRHTRPQTHEWPHSRIWRKISI